MRLLKSQTTNTRSIQGDGVKLDAGQQPLVDSVKSLIVPKGTTAERPMSGVEGQLRYNTSDGEFEVYQDSAWRELRFKEPNKDPGIVVQSLGDGDFIETVFGPLASGDPDYPVPVAAQNVIVLVDNVFQVAARNYTLEQSVNNSLAGPNAPYADGSYLVFGSPPDLGVPVIAIHNFDK